MSAQRLSEKSKRRIERSIGEPVLRAWAHGGYWFDFVTPDHRHGLWHKTSHEVQWPDHFGHYQTCEYIIDGRYQFPEGSRLD